MLDFFLKNLKKKHKSKQNYNNSCELLNNGTQMSNTGFYLIHLLSSRAYCSRSSGVLPTHYRIPVFLN